MARLLCVSTSRWKSLLIWTRWAPIVCWTCASAWQILLASFTSARPTVMPIDERLKNQYTCKLYMTSIHEHFYWGQIFKMTRHSIKLFCHGDISFHDIVNFSYRLRMKNIHTNNTHCRPIIYLLQTFFKLGNRYIRFTK